VESHTRALARRAGARRGDDEGAATLPFDFLVSWLLRLSYQLIARFSWADKHGVADSAL
jgi:hypothetical protein